MKHQSNAQRGQNNRNRSTSFFKENLKNPVKAKLLSLACSRSSSSRLTSRKWPRWLVLQGEGGQAGTTRDDAADLVLLSTYYSSTRHHVAAE